MGAFDELSPLSLHMLGMHGSAYANNAMQKADLILALGARWECYYYFFTSIYYGGLEGFPSIFLLSLFLLAFNMVDWKVSILSLLAHFLLAFFKMFCELTKIMFPFLFLHSLCLFFKIIFFVLLFLFLPKIWWSCDWKFKCFCSCCIRSWISWRGWDCTFWNCK